MHTSSDSVACAGDAAAPWPVRQLPLSHRMGEGRGEGLILSRTHGSLNPSRRRPPNHTAEQGLFQEVTARSKDRVHGCFVTLFGEANRHTGLRANAFRIGSGLSISRHRFKMSRPMISLMKGTGPCISL